MGMFENFYALKHTPFSRDIPTDDLYLSNTLEETLRRLHYAAERQLLAVITSIAEQGKPQRFVDLTINWMHRSILCSTFPTPS